MIKSVTRRDVLRLCLGFSTATLTSGFGVVLASDGCSPTGADDKGPFYIAGAPSRNVLAGPDEPGERLIVRGRILGSECKTLVPNALLDVWHADAAGRYHSEKENYRLRGQLRSNKMGAYEISTIKPGGYPVEGGGFRPAHIHFAVTHPAYQPLMTQLYFEGDPHLGSDDGCGKDCHSDDPDRILELNRVEKGDQTWVEARFDVVLIPIKK
jgi:catechol 1,2-dioxygenase